MGYHVNFQTFPGAFITLFRCATGEAWNSIMFEVTWTQSILYQCEPSETYQTIVDAGRDPSDWLGPRGCGDKVWAYVFFTVFQILITQIYINLTIAIIVDSFTGILGPDRLPVGSELMEIFVKTWKNLDPEATFYIRLEQLEDLLKQLHATGKF